MSESGNPTPIGDPAAQQPAPAEALPILEYGSPSRQRLVTIARFGKAFEAHLAAGKLESEGIGVFVVNEHASTAVIGWYDNAMGGIQLQVAERDAARAVALLPTPRVPGKPVCPKCGSQDVMQSHFLRNRVITVVLLLGLPLLFTEAPCQCTACGHYWQGEPDDEDEDDDEPRQEHPESVSDDEDAPRPEA